MPSLTPAAPTRRKDKHSKIDPTKQPLQDYVKSLEKIRNSKANHADALQRLQQVREQRLEFRAQSSLFPSSLPPTLDEIDDSDLGEHGEIMSELGFSNLMPSAWELHARRAILMAAATNGASIGSLQTMDEAISESLLVGSCLGFFILCEASGRFG